MPRGVDGQRYNERMARKRWPKTRHKYNAKPTTVGGRRYASKKEAEYAEGLHLRKKAGEILGWLEQVPIKFSSGIKYVVDFVVFEADGMVRFIEVKGAETQVWRNKMAMLADEYPWLDVEVVR